MLEPPSPPGKPSNDESLPDLRQPARDGVPRRGWRCPPPEQIAAYLDQRLPADEKDRLEAHLADCDFCLGLVGSIVRQQDTQHETEPTPMLLRQAIDVVAAPRAARWSWRWAVAPAVAALVIASALLLKSPEVSPVRSTDVAAPAARAAPAVEQPPTSAPERPKGPAATHRAMVRNVPSASSELQVLEPRSGSMVTLVDLRFRWKPAAAALYYEIRIVDTEGHSIWRTESLEPQAQVPSGLELSPGKYFVMVHAHLNDGRTLKSEAVAFRIKAPG